MRIWRNWQTRTVQVRVKVTSWRFESFYPHQKNQNLVCCEVLVFCYAVLNKDSNLRRHERKAETSGGGFGTDCRQTPSVSMPRAYVIIWCCVRNEVSFLSWSLADKKINFFNFLHQKALNSCRISSKGAPRQTFFRKFWKKVWKSANLQTFCLIFMIFYIFGGFFISKIPFYVNSLTNFQK